MASIGALLRGILLAGAAYHRIEAETLTGGLRKQLVGEGAAVFAVDEADIPQWLALAGHQDGITHL